MSLIVDSKSEVYLYKNQFHLLILSWDTAKIFQKLLFWVLWAWLAIITNIDSINFQKGLFICMQKFKFMSLFFPEKLQIYRELVVLGTLGMPGNSHQKQWCLLQGNFNAYLHAKNEIYLSSLSCQDIANLLL